MIGNDPQQGLFLPSDEVTYLDIGIQHKPVLTHLSVC